MQTHKEEGALGARSTTTTKWNNLKRKKSEIKHPHKSRYSHSDLQQPIEEKITNPNETWLILKRKEYMTPRKEYMTPKTYLGTYS